MLREITRRWWLVLLRGICAVLFGILAFTWPGVTLWALVVMFGVYTLADGVAGVALGISGAGGSSWWAMVLLGLLGIGAGVVTFLWPGVTAVALLVIIATWAIAHGILEIAAALKLRKVIEGEGLLILAGALSVLFGLLLLARPGAGAVAVVWLIGGYAIAFGIVAIALSMRLRGLNSRLASAAG